MNPSSFDIPRETLDWAHAAIDELEGTLREFFNDNPYKIIAEDDLNGLQKVYKLVLTRPMPRVSARRTTEALTRTKEVFDQIVFAACAEIGEPRRDSIYFPWSTNPTDLERRLKGKKPEPTYPVALWDTFKRLEPYGRGETYAGGDDEIREMAKLANDKHTVGIAPAPSVGVLSQPTISGTIPAAALRAGGGVSFPASRWDPKKNEMVIASIAIGPNVEFKCSVNTDIAFTKAGPMCGKSIFAALRRFAEQAQLALKTFESRCAELKPR